MLNIADDVRIKGIRPLISPGLLMEKLPITERALNTVVEARNIASNIIQGRDSRLIVVVGPCSIHDQKAAIEYAHLLKKAHDQYKNELLIIMRIYFEKPRTTVGWKGLINDPNLDGSFDINKGLEVSRHLLLELANMQLPAGCEFLDTIIPQYISDLVSWGAIGARTTESQIHRELASGLSMPIGFKNGTRGNVQIAIDAIRAAKEPHHFLSVTKHGLAAIVSTTGNEACHVILRGSSTGPNYQTEHIKETVEKLKHNHLLPYLMVDFSHGNSDKDPAKQAVVAKDICEQLSRGEKAISGVMIESNLMEGNQPLSKEKELIYGKSITDACLSWQQTIPLLEQLSEAVIKRRRVVGVSHG